MNGTRNPGRVAGLWYLVLIILGPLYLVYIPDRIQVQGNAAATVNNIASHEWLFRLGLADELACGVILVFLVLALYRLFRNVDAHLAVLVVILGGVLQAAISFVSVVANAVALRVVTDADVLSAFARPQRDGLVMLLLLVHHYQVTASLLLSGAWLFPLGTLVYRSRFLPRFLGVWLLIGGVGWVLLFLTAVLMPEYQDRVFRLSQPAFFGEIALMLWLLIRGARAPSLPDAAPMPGAG